MILLSINGNKKFEGGGGMRKFSTIPISKYRMHTHTLILSMIPRSATMTKTLSKKVSIQVLKGDIYSE